MASSTRSSQGHGRARHVLGSLQKLVVALSHFLRCSDFPSSCSTFADLPKEILHSSNLPCSCSSFADLPIDILHSIQKLLAIDDYIRFTAVCKSWKSAAKDNPHSSSKEAMPWLFFFKKGKMATTICFSSRNDKHGKTYEIHIPHHLQHHLIISSWGHCLVTRSSYDQCSNIHIINPFLSWTQVGLLPSMATLPAAKAFIKIVLDNTCSIAVAIVRRGLNNLLAYTRSGSDRWEWIRADSYELFRFRDLVFFNGKFYALGNGNMVAQVDISSSSAITVRDATFDHKVPWVSFEIAHSCLVASTSHLFMIRLVLFEEPRRKNVYVYKLCLDQGRWVPARSLDDGCCFFIGGGQSLCLSATDPPGMHLRRSNCIYFSSLESSDYGLRIFYKGSKTGAQSIKCVDNQDNYELIYNLRDERWERFDGHEWINEPVQGLWIMPSFR